MVFTGCSEQQARQSVLAEAEGFEWDFGFNRLAVRARQPPRQGALTGQVVDHLP